MRIRRLFRRAPCLSAGIMMLAVSNGLTGPAHAQNNAKAAPPASHSPARKALEQAAEDGKFTFLVFYKTDTPELREMAKVAKAGVAKRTDKAVVVFVQTTDPAEKSVVDQFDVARSPMPLTLAVAPTMAITGVFPRVLKDEYIEESIVTPVMTRCMKSLQEGKLVFVCLQSAENTPAPAVVKAMQFDPEFGSRVAVFNLQVRDPAEARFLQQMQVEAAQVRAPLATLLAPPGLLIGKYDSAATKAQVVGALHHAGKCCDDPNCKHHHHHHGPSTQAPASSTRK